MPENLWKTRAWSNFLSFKWSSRPVPFIQILYTYLLDLYYYQCCGINDESRPMTVLLILSYPGQAPTICHQRDEAGKYVCEHNLSIISLVRAHNERHPFCPSVTLNTWQYRGDQEESLAECPKSTSTSCTAVRTLASLVRLVITWPCVQNNQCCLIFS